MKFVAVIPAHNEENRISPVIQVARECLPVVVVDDGSTDKTREISLKSGADVIRHDANQGKGVVLKRGFNHALGAC
jgi:glycosyltransferase involved in cell wall biosynthesis